MAIKKYKPTSPGSRQRVSIDYKKVLSRFEEYNNSGNSSKTGEDSLFRYPVSSKKIHFGTSKKGGRANTGRLTVYTKGGGHKKKYKLVDFKRNNSLGTNLSRTQEHLFSGFEGETLSISKYVVEAIEYDPFRSAFVALLVRLNGEPDIKYILAPDGIKKGDVLEEGPLAKLQIGSSLPLANIPIGSTIYNIELKPGHGAQLVRSAGNSATLIQKDKDYASVRLTSGELRLIPLECYASIGSVSNPNHKNVVISKAGRSRWLGKRPSVRGVAMNPVDHPHGGGEGKTSGGRPSVSPWGKLTKGPKTRKVSKKSNLILKSRREK